MFSGPEIADMLADLGVSHVVWLPDSALGTWEQTFEQSPAFKLVRVCREGEAWAIAAGLLIGGQQPIIMMQTTGLFESGDAMRNVLFDLKLPLLAVVGNRSALVPDSADTARRFAEPILKAWNVDYVTVAGPEELPRMTEHFRACQTAGKPGVVLLAEGK